MNDFNAFTASMKDLATLPVNKVSAIVILSAKVGGKNHDKLELTCRPTQDPNERRTITISLSCGSKTAYDIGVAPLVAKMGCTDQGTLIPAINERCPFSTEVYVRLAASQDRAKDEVSGFTNYFWEQCIIDAKKDMEADKEATPAEDLPDSVEEIKATKKK